MAALLGRFRHIAESILGVPLSSITVEIRRQGATARAASGAANLAVTVEDAGALVTGSVDTVEIWRGGTTQVSSSGGSTTFSVVTVSGTTVTLGGYSGTLSISDDDRLVPTNSLPSLYVDAAGTEADSNPLTATGADGVSTCWVAGGYYDVKLSGSGFTTTILSDVVVWGEKSSATDRSSTVSDTVNVAKWTFDTVNAGTAEATHAGAGASEYSIHTEWKDAGERAMVLHGGVASAHDVSLRVGRRAVTSGGSDEKYTVYASEAYTSDLSAAQEIHALHGISTLSGAQASGATCAGVHGEFQFVPTTAKTASDNFIGVQGFARYGGSHASAQCQLLMGGSFKAVCSDGSSGTVVNMRSLNVEPPSGTGPTVTTASSLNVTGPAAGYCTGRNTVAILAAPADEASDIIFRSAPIRIDDEDNNANSANAGYWVDIVRDWDGADVGPLYVGVHMTLTLEGTFDSGDDGYGFRSVTRTGAVNGDGANLDIMGGYQAVVAHRSDQTLDECYGVLADLTMSGAGTTTTMAAYDARLTHSAGTVANAYSAILRSLTPSASYASVGHMRLVPVSLATPATTLAALTAEQEMTIIAVTDANNATNSGIYFYINGAWYGLTAARLAGGAWPAGGFAATDS